MQRVTGITQRLHPHFVLATACRNDIPVQEAQPYISFKSYVQTSIVTARS